MIKVLIADDHAVVRQGLKEMITTHYARALIGEAASAEEALELIREQEWDVLILDIHLPGRNGLDIMPDIKRQRPKLPVLFLSMHSEEDYGLRALRSGAAGYLTKGSSPEEFLKALRTVCQGKKFISLSLAGHVADQLEAPTGKAPHEYLSNRELEVMRMIATGQSISEIAAILSLSVKTISTYRSRILEKMRMKTNTDLTRYALRHSLITE